MFWRKRSTEDFAEEIKAHLALEADELEREGWSEDEAPEGAACLRQCPRGAGTLLS